MCVSFACGAYGTCVRQVFLLDKMSLARCLSGGRSRSFGVLAQARQMYAYFLAPGIIPHLRWILSELNSSDEPSRIAAKKGSELATHAIEHLRFAREARGRRRAPKPFRPGCWRPATGCRAT